MAYGPPKFSTSQVIDSTLAAIRQELEKNSDLSSGNLAFYGFEVEFDIKLKLTARGNSDQEVRGKVEVGEVRPLPLPGTSNEPKEDKGTLPTTDFIAAIQQLKKPEEKGVMPTATGTNTPDSDMQPVDNPPSTGSHPPPPPLKTVPVQVQSNVRRGRQRVQNPAPVNK